MKNPRKTPQGVLLIDVKVSGFDPMTQGSTVQIPAVAELSFGIELTFCFFGTQ